MTIYYNTYYVYAYTFCHYRNKMAIYYNTYYVFSYIDNKKQD